MNSYDINEMEVEKFISIHLVDMTITYLGATILFKTWVGNYYYKNGK